MPQLSLSLIQSISEKYPDLDRSVSVACVEDLVKCDSLIEWVLGDGGLFLVHPRLVVGMKDNVVDFDISAIGRSLLCVRKWQIFSE